MTGSNEILKETLDVDLWKALSIMQGEAIDQPDLKNKQALSAALDKAAGVQPAASQELGLFKKFRRNMNSTIRLVGVPRRRNSRTCGIT